MKKFRFPWPFLVALMGCNIAFISMILVLSWHNRVSADDYEMIFKTRELGILGTVWDHYVHWIGRWSAVATASLFSRFSAEFGRLGFFTVITLTYFATAVSACIDSFYDWLAENGGQKPGAFTRINIGIFVAHLLYFVTPNTRESFHWLCGAVCYGWGVSHALLCAALLSRPARPNLIRAILAVLSAALAAGSNEVLGAFVVVTLVLATAIAMIRSKQTRLPILAASLASAAGSFLFMAIAPGNRIRNAGFNYHPGFYEAVLTTVKLSWSFTNQHVASHWAWLAGASAFFMLLVETAAPARRRFSFQGLIVALFLFFFLIEAANWLIMFPGAFLSGNLPPDRSWVANSTVTFLAFSLLGSWIGMRLKPLKPGLQSGLCLVFSALIIAIGGFRASILNRLIPSVTAYSQAYDNRLEMLRAYQTQHRTMPVELEALPYQDTFSYVQWDVPHISRAFELPFKTIPRYPY